jgi:amidophosphoribosyltransferase
MSDAIQHECGIAFLRLKKPLDYYREKYGTPLYGINKMQIMMQKMRNRGQDGAGLASIKLDMEPGERYISRKRTVGPQYLRDLFDGVHQHFQGKDFTNLSDREIKLAFPYVGEVFLGHLRYGTHGINTIEACHPVLRQNNWISRNLLLAGNFNLTNVDELFSELVELGQYPKEVSDTVTVLEKIGHFLDDEVQRLFKWYKPDGFTNREINQLIFDNLDVAKVVSKATKKFDGGYILGGLIGYGDAFMMRDPNGIRPAYWFEDDEIVVAASERPAIQTAFDIRYKYIKELDPGHVLVVKHSGEVTYGRFTEERPITPCSFERIYFSRGNDRDIYLERKRLGHMLADIVLKEVDFDFRNTVFSYVPNTAESAFFGLIEGLESRLNEIKINQINALEDKLDVEAVRKILELSPRIEKLVVKDEKLRTFITDDASRGDLVSHVYDVTYGIVQDGVDTLVLLDDSIVRGTTLKDSIISILARLNPKRIIIASSAPQIRFPDCYGIDMSKMKSFIAFEAMLSLLEERGQEHKLEEVYEKCLGQQDFAGEDTQNYVKDLYDLFGYEEISSRIAELLTPKGIKAEVKIIFQTLEGLHAACPGHKGDWYFSGNFPTPGGNKVVNRAFMNFMEGKDIRAY